MRKHAMLSASGASRWLVCTPSAQFETQFEEVESSYADEGTLAHKLAEIMIKRKAGWPVPDRFFNEIMADELYSEEMWGLIEEYAEFIVDKVREAPPHTLLLQEQHLNLTRWIPEGFGTVDIGLVAPGSLEVVDYKHGKGVPVDAHENSQMKVYALGLLDLFEPLYDIDTIIMTIYQPRIGNISTFTMTPQELLQWAEEVLKPTAKIAFQGLGEFVAGDHCRFCRARATCVANAKLNLQLAAREFEITTITDEQVVKVLRKADSMKKWITAVEEHALHMAVNRGKKWPGMKVVQGRSVRRYTNEAAILEGLTKEGYAIEDLVKSKIVGITEMTRIIEKADIDKYVTPYVHKPAGAPTLVDESDQRPEFNSNVAAYLDFEETTE